MSFFSKMLSKVGVGAATIDAVLDHEQAEPGQPISGVINIVGGKVDQQINKIDLDVYCNYFVEETIEEDNESHTRKIEKTCRINSFDIAENFTIGSGEKKKLNFSFELSPHAPLSAGHCKSWLKTNLDIDYALDTDDKDYIDIRPNPLQAATIAALIDLGFEVVEVESEGCHCDRTTLPFIQEFEFVARSGEFRGKLDEVELVMFINGDNLDIFLEIDRRSKGLGGFFATAFGRDETNVHLTISPDEVEQLGDMLHEIISENC